MKRYISGMKSVFKDAVRFLISSGSLVMVELAREQNKMPRREHSDWKIGEMKNIISERHQDPTLPIKSIYCLRWSETLNSSIAETHGLL